MSDNTLIKRCNHCGKFPTVSKISHVNQTMDQDDRGLWYSHEGDGKTIGYRIHCDNCSIETKRSDKNGMDATAFDMVIGVWNANHGILDEKPVSVLEWIANHVSTQDPNTNISIIRDPDGPGEICSISGKAERIATNIYHQNSIWYKLLNSRRFDVRHLSTGIKIVVYMYDDMELRYDDWGKETTAKG